VGIVLVLLLLACVGAGAVAAWRLALSIGG
jgi:hypothetical protein